MQKPLILITNDDGITAPGIRALIQVMLPLGEVVVVAPDSPQSGMGHAITTTSALFCEQVHTQSGAPLEYRCSGTPVDCVKIAKHELLKRTPDLCVSGINHGSNSSINVIYSGTMSAAVEAGVGGIPAIGFSLLDMNWNADFSQCTDFVRNITLNVLQNGLPHGVVLNVNIPKLKREEIKGVKVCRQAPTGKNALIIASVHTDVIIIGLRASSSAKTKVPTPTYGHWIMAISRLYLSMPTLPITLL